MTSTDTTEPAAVESDPAGALIASEDSQQVALLIDELPENQQQVLRLRFHAGLKYREISQTTGLSETNVGFLLHTALQTLREQMRVAGVVLGNQCRHDSLSLTYPIEQPSNLDIQS